MGTRRHTEGNQTNKPRASALLWTKDKTDAHTYPRIYRNQSSIPRIYGVRNWLGRGSWASRGDDKKKTSTATKTEMATGSSAQLQTGRCSRDNNVRAHCERVTAEVDTHPRASERAVSRRTDGLLRLSHTPIAGAAVPPPAVPGWRVPFPQSPGGVSWAPQPSAAGAARTCPRSVAWPPAWLRLPPPSALDLRVLFPGRFRRGVVKLARHTMDTYAGSIRAASFRYPGAYRLHSRRASTTFMWCAGSPGSSSSTLNGRTKKISSDGF